MKIQHLIPHTTIIAGLCALCFIGSASAQTPAVSGKYIGNGKNAELKFVSAAEDKPFDDKPAIKLIFTEKDPTQSKDPDRDALFGKLGSTLSLSVFHNGEVFSSQVGHAALKKSGFSTNSFKMTEFKIADGKITGRVSTGEEREFFGETYEADLTFTAALAKSESESKSPAKPASGPLNAAQKAFLDSYKKALETKDTKALAAFLHTEGASADTIEFFTMMQSAGTEGQIESIELIKPSDEEMKKFNQPKEMPDGQLARMPFAPTHQLSIVIKDSSGTSTSKLPVGEHKGKLVIPVPVPVNASSKAASTAPTKSRTTKPAEAPIEEKANKAIKDALKNLPKGLRF
jgi:hypothetical protein